MDPELEELADILAAGNPQAVLNALKISGSPEAFTVIDALSKGEQVPGFETNIPPEAFRKIGEEFQNFRSDPERVRQFATQTAELIGGDEGTQVAQTILERQGVLSVDEEAELAERVGDDPGEQFARGNILGGLGATGRQAAGGALAGISTLGNLALSAPRAIPGGERFLDNFAERQAGVREAIEENIAGPGLGGLDVAVPQALGEEAVFLLPGAAAGQAARRPAAFAGRGAERLAARAPGVGEEAARATGQAVERGVRTGGVGAGITVPRFPDRVRELEEEGLDRPAAIWEAIKSTGIEIGITAGFGASNLGGLEAALSGQFGRQASQGALNDFRGRLRDIAGGAFRGAGEEIPEELIQTHIENTRLLLREAAREGEELPLRDAMARAVSDPRFAESYQLAASVAGILGGTVGGVAAAPRGAEQPDTTAERSALGLETEQERAAPDTDEGATQDVDVGAPEDVDVGERGDTDIDVRARQVAEEEPGVTTAEGARRAAVAQDIDAPADTETQAPITDEELGLDPATVETTEAAQDTILGTEDIDPEDLETSLVDAEESLSEAVPNATVTRQGAGLRVQLPGGADIGVRITTPQELAEIAAQPRNAAATFASMRRNGSVPTRRRGNTTRSMTLNEWQALTPNQRKRVMVEQGRTAQGRLLANPELDVPLNLDAMVDLVQGEFNADTLTEELNHFQAQALLTPIERRQAADVLRQRGVDVGDDTQLATNPDFIEGFYREYKDWLRQRAITEEDEALRATEPGLFKIFRNLFNRIRDLFRGRQAIEDNPLSDLFERVRTGEVAQRPVQEDFQQRPRRRDEIQQQRGRVQRRQRREDIQEEARKIRAEAAIPQAEATRERAQRALVKARRQALDDEFKAQEAEIRSSEAVAQRNAEVESGTSLVDLDQRISEIRDEQARLQRDINQRLERLDTVQDRIDRNPDNPIVNIWNSTAQELDDSVTSMRRQIQELTREATALNARKGVIRQETQQRAREQRQREAERAARPRQEPEEGGGETFATREEQLAEIAPERVAAASQQGINPRNRALRGTTEEARSLEIIQRALRGPTVIADSDVLERGRELLRQAPSRRALIESVEAKISSNRDPSVEEVIALKELLADQSEKLSRNFGKNPSAATPSRLLALKASHVLDEVGTRWSAIGRALRDPISTPEGRRQNVFNSLMQPSRETRLKIQELREAGREGEKDALLAREFKAQVQRFRALMRRSGFDPDDFDSAFANPADAFNIMSAANVAREGRSYGGLINLFLSQNLLGLSSILVQVPSGLAAAAMVGGERVLQGMVNDVITMLTGSSNPNLPTTREVAAGARAAVAGFIHSLADAAYAFVSGQSPTLMRMGRGEDVVERLDGFKDPAREAFPTNRLAQVLISPIFRSMAAVDEIFMAAAANASREMHAVRTGRKRGFTGDALAEFVDRQRDPELADHEVMSLAVDAAEDLTFKRPFNPDTFGGKFGDGLQRLKNQKMWGTEFRLGSAVVPFFRTGLRLAEFTGRRAPGSSLLFLMNDIGESVSANRNPDATPEQRERRKLQIYMQTASALFGMAMTGLLAATMDEEDIAELAEGRFRGADIKRLDPGSTFLDFAADSVQVMRGDKNPRELSNSLIASMANALPTENLSRLTGRRFGKEPDILGNFGRQFMRMSDPFGGVFRDIRELHDPRKRDFDTDEPTDELRRREGVRSALLELFNIRQEPEAPRL